MDKVVHFEIPVEDVGRAKEFYVSSRFQRDCDVTNVAHANGDEVKEMGFTANFKDPEGNIVGLWQEAKS